MSKYDPLKIRKPTESEKQFDLRIKEIEATYKDYFSNVEPGNHINKYFGLYKSDGRYYLTWHNEHKLDPEIIRLVNQAAREVFGLPDDSANSQKSP